MKAQLFWKRIDFAAQLLALFIPVALMGIYRNGGYIIFAYFSVGFVQSLSCVCTALLATSTSKSLGRRIYQIVLIIVIVLFPVLSLLGCGERGNILYLKCLVLFSPVMAIWYIATTWKEMRQLYIMVDRKQHLLSN